MKTPVTRLARQGGKPQLGLAALIAKCAYGRTPDVDDPKNANKDWRAGYAVGLDKKDGESLDPVHAEWLERGMPNAHEASFSEWKIGYWAGVFTRFDALSKPAPGSRGRKGKT